MLSLSLGFFGACPSLRRPRSASRGDCFGLLKSLRTPRTGRRTDPGPVSMLNDGCQILGEIGSIHLAYLTSESASPRFFWTSPSSHPKKPVLALTVLKAKQNGARVGSVPARVCSEGER